MSRNSSPSGLAQVPRAFGQHTTAATTFAAGVGFSWTFMARRQLHSSTKGLTSNTSGKSEIRVCRAARFLAFSWGSRPSGRVGWLMPPDPAK